MTSDINHERITYEGIVYSIFFLIATFLVDITYKTLKDFLGQHPIIITYLSISMLLIFLGMSILFAKFYVKIKNIEYSALTKRPYSALPPVLLDTSIILSLILIITIRAGLLEYCGIIHLCSFLLVFKCFLILFNKIEKRLCNDIKNVIKAKPFIIHIIILIIPYTIKLLCAYIMRTLCSSSHDINIITLTITIYVARFLPEIVVK